MVIDWLRFAAALALLLTPVALLQGEKVRFRPIERSWDRHWTQILTLGLHTIDLGRAALGNWLLLDAVSASPAAHGLMRYAPLLLPGGVRLLAVLVQTAFCREPDSANAPFAFVTGLLLGGVSPLVAIFAIALGATIAMGARTPVVFFPMVAATDLAVASLFGGRALVMRVAAGAMAAALPWLWNLLFSRPLVISYRKMRRETPQT